MDAVILADAGLMRYAVKHHPDLRLHLSVQGSATSYEAVNFYREHFGIQRAVLPRVLSLPQVENVVKTHRCRDRAVRLRRPVRDGGRALPAVVVLHR